MQFTKNGHYVIVLLGGGQKSSRPHSALFVALLTHSLEVQTDRLLQ